jgi:hypothetical protein
MRCGALDEIKEGVRALEVGGIAGAIERRLRGP